MIDRIRKAKTTPGEDFRHRLRWGAVIVCVVVVLPIVLR